MSQTTYKLKYNITTDIIKACANHAKCHYVLGDLAYILSRLLIVKVVKLDIDKHRNKKQYIYIYIYNV